MEHSGGALGGQYGENLYRWAGKKLCLGGSLRACTAGGC